MHYRKAVAGILLLLVALEMLPSACWEAPVSLAAVAGSSACSIGQVQVCDQGDPLLGALVDLSVLVPGALDLTVVAEVRQLAPDVALFSPDGFRPAIDRPPKHSA
jgi:hypothetical protein